MNYKGVIIPAFVPLSVGTTAGEGGEKHEL